MPLYTSSPAEQHLLRIVRQYIDERLAQIDTRIAAIERLVEQMQVDVEDAIRGEGPDQDEDHEDHEPLEFHRKRRRH